MADDGSVVAAYAEPEPKHKLAPVVPDSGCVGVGVGVGVGVAAAVVVCAAPELEHTLAPVAAGTWRPWLLAVGTTAYRPLAGGSTHQCLAADWRRGKAAGSVTAVK